MSQVIIAKPGQIASSAVEMLVSAIEQAITLRGSAYVALSGGTVPNQMWRILRQSRLDYTKIHWFWADERMVDYELEQSNFGVAWREWLRTIEGSDQEMLNRQAGSTMNVYPMLGWQLRPSPSGSPLRKGKNNQNYLESCIRDYTKQLEILPRNLDGMPCFDLILLGMGEDGHTASLFPMNMEDDLKNQAWVIGLDNSPKPPKERLSLNYPVLTAAGELLFVVAGESKARAVREIVSQRSIDYPAGVVSAGASEVCWLLDEAAASEL